MRKNLLLLVVSLAVTLLLAEGVLRLWYPAPPIWKEPQILHLRSPRLGWVLPPGAKGYTIDAPVAVNSLGLRDDEIPLHRPPGETRILALGDSFTFALGVRFEDLYVQRLEKELGARDPGRRFQVVNAGVAGYGTQQELVYLLGQGFALDPQLVTIGFYWNDLLGNDRPLPEPGTPVLSEDQSFFDRPARHLIPTAFRNALRRSLLLYLGTTRISALLERIGGHESELQRVQRALLEGDQEFLQPYWEHTGLRLRQIADACRAHGIPALLVVFPMENQIRHEYPDLVWIEQIRKIWAPTGMPLIDLEPTFRAALARGENPFLPYDLHPGPVGMRLTADAILATIDSDGLLRPGAVAEASP